MDTLKIDLYSALCKDGYIRLMYIRFGPRTDLTKVFPNIQGGKNPNDWWQCQISDAGSMTDDQIGLLTTFVFSTKF